MIEIQTQCFNMLILLAAAAFNLFLTRSLPGAVATGLLPRQTRSLIGMRPDSNLQIDHSILYSKKKRPT